MCTTGSATHELFASLRLRPRLRLRLIFRLMFRLRLRLMFFFVLTRVKCMYVDYRCVCRRDTRAVCREVSEHLVVVGSLGGLTEDRPHLKPSHALFFLFACVHVCVCVCVCVFIGASCGCWIP
jgi:hypothetical protein